MADNQRDGLLWISNVPTPYRAPLWAAIAERHKLTVALMAETEPNRNWDIDMRQAGHGTVFLRAKPLTTSGDSVIYAPSWRLLSMISERPRAIVIDGWESPAYMAARWWAARLRVPVIASYRSTLGTRRFSSGPIPLARRWFFKGANLVLTAGEASSEAVREIGVAPDKILEGFNTVDVRRFSRAAALRSTSAESLGHHYLYVGQFIPRKNVDGLVRAFQEAREPQDTLTLVGNGPEEAGLQNLTDQLDLRPAVRFAGALDGDDLVKAYASANTLVLPSKEEVWGLVVNEGLAAGLQVVVSNSCGIVPSIKHMPGVITSDPEPPKLAAALRESKDEWSGPMLNHPITRHSPEELASVVLKAVEKVAPTR